MKSKLPKATVIQGRIEWTEELRDDVFRQGTLKFLEGGLARLNMLSKGNNRVPLSPADEPKLKLVFELLSLLPGDWSIEVKLSALQTQEIDAFKKRIVARERRLAADKTLKRRPLAVPSGFWNKFQQPLGPEYQTIFLAAGWWLGFIEHVKKLLECTVEKDGKKHFPRLPNVKAQLRFRDYGLHDLVDVAVFRLVRELHHTGHSEFWKRENEAPSSQLIGHARRRLQAYFDARQRAGAEFDKLLLLKPTGDDIEGNEARLPTGFWSLSLYKQQDLVGGLFARGLNDSQKWRAAAIACGLLSDDDREAFGQNEFAKLHPAEMEQFLKLCQCPPSAIKKHQYTVLKTWLLDNAPVFERFGWHWPGIFKAVQGRFDHYPGSTREDGEPSLKEWCHRNGVRLKLHRGTVRNKAELAAQPKAQLLTERPAIRLKS
jgi:hypothetical protein